MADEHVHQPAGHLPPPAPARTAAPFHEQIAPGAPALPSQGSGPQPSLAVPRSEAAALLRWAVGLCLVLVCGWGFIACAGYLAYTGKLGLSVEWACGVAAALSLALFVLLEQNLWLSRFMGLRLGPNAAVWPEVLVLWLFGVAGLLVRPAATEPTSARIKAAPEADSFREVVETIVFVVVLVLLLKSFLAEAFVIPTGSMATTLLGYHRNVTCPQCGYQFDVNASKEVDAQEGELQPVTGCTCPNCRLHIELPRNMEGILQP